MKKIALFILFLCTDCIYAYSYSRSESTGNNLKWKSRNGVIKNIEMKFDETTVPSSYTANDIRRRISDTIDKWKRESSYDNSNFQLEVVDNHSNEDVSYVYFDNEEDSIYLGSGILGITLSQYYVNSGEVVSSRIILNEDLMVDILNFNLNQVEDVLTHEFGHVLGLSHSEVHHSSMFYLHFDGQKTLHQDDASGVYSVYPDRNLDRGYIEGRVIGGVSGNSVGIFGSHVQAISQNTGETVAGVITDTEGNFKIDGLPLDDTYYIYTSSLKRKSDISSYYNNVRENFCDSGSSYRGSFFESCNTSSLGYPHGIKLTSSVKNMDVGNITIRCELNTPSAYGTDRTSGFSLSSGGDAFVGFFTRDQISLGTVDDIITIETGNYTPGANEFIELTVMSQSLYSIMKFDVNEGSQCPTQGTCGSVVDADGNENLDVVRRIPLQSGVQSQQFSVYITPFYDQTYLDTDSDCISSSSVSQDFPGCEDFKDDLSFYFLTYKIIRVLADSSVEVVSEKTFTNSNLDNLACVSGPQSYLTTANFSGDSSDSSDSDSGGGCGSISTGNSGGPPSGGLFSLLLGFFVTLLGSHFSNKLRRPIGY